MEEQVMEQNKLNLWHTIGCLFKETRMAAAFLTIKSLRSQSISKFMVSRGTVGREREEGASTS